LLKSWVLWFVLDSLGFYISAFSLRPLNMCSCAMPRLRHLRTIRGCSFSHPLDLCRHPNKICHVTLANMRQCYWLVLGEIVRLCH
jgi:hypothetical protein